MEPIFFEREDIEAAQKELIERYGGIHGLRDEGLLLSALAMPQASFGGEYLHSDLFQMAAAYLFHLVQNHPFVDGNKRIGLYAALVFLELNEIEVIADPDELADFVLSVARSEKDKDEISKYFRQLVEATENNPA